MNAFRDGPAARDGAVSMTATATPTTMPAANNAPSTRPTSAPAIAPDGRTANALGATTPAVITAAPIQTAVITAAT